MKDIGSMLSWDVKYGLACFFAYPLVMYMLSRWGGATWEDIKQYAYKVWDFIKSFKK